MRKPALALVFAVLSICRIGASEMSSQVYSHFLNALVLERNGELEGALAELNRTLELAPMASSILRQRANLHLKMGNPEKALVDTQAYVKTHPEDPESLKLLANIYLMKGQNQAARIILEKIVELDPKDYQTTLDLALLLLNDDPAAAARRLERLTQIEPRSAEAYYHLGLAYQKAGDMDKSKAAFERVVSLDPSSLPALFLLGQMSERSGKPEEAIAHYEAALEKMPDNSALRMQLVMLHASRTDLPAIERLLDYFKDDPNAPVEANLWLGVVAESKKDWDAALKYYVKAQNQADTPEIHLRLASIYSHLGKVTEAMKSLQALIEKNPNSPQYRYFLGLAYLDLKKPAKAVTHLEKAVEINKNFSSAYFQLGIAYDQMEDWKKAESYFRQAIAVDTTNASAYNYIGYTLADRNENLHEARRMIERALELDHDNPAFIDSLGWLDYREGKYKQALMHLKSAASLVPDPVIREHLGDCYGAMGKKSEAAQSYAQSLEADSSSEKVRKKLDELERYLVPTSPARKILKAFQYHLKQANHISGPFFMKGNFGVASWNFSQGVFYLRQQDPVLSASSANAQSDLRVDLLSSVLVPSVILRYKSLSSTLSVFPPEFKKDMPDETAVAMGTVVSFLNGKILSEFDTPETEVADKRKTYVLTRGDRKIILDKASGVIKEIVTPNCRITIPKYRTVGEISLPENLKFDLAISNGSKSVWRRFEIRFSTLSLDKIESRVFEPMKPGE